VGAPGGQLPGSTRKHREKMKNIIQAFSLMLKKPIARHIKLPDFLRLALLIYLNLNSPFHAEAIHITLYN
jgi:hypothetical protein